MSGYVFVLNLSKSGESSHQRCSVKKGALRNFAKFTGNFCEISKSTFSTKYLGTSASGLAMFYLDQMEIVCSAQHHCHWYER